MTARQFRQLAGPRKLRKAMKPAQWKQLAQQELRKKEARK